MSLKSFNLSNEIEGTPSLETDLQNVVNDITQIMEVLKFKQN